VDITEAERVLKDLEKRALLRPISWEVLKIAKEKGVLPPTNNELTVRLAGGLQVTLTFEHQQYGLVRHASFSTVTGEAESMPAPLLIRELLPFLGFTGSLKDCHLWIEDLSHGKKAVNVIQPHDGDWSPFITDRPGSV